MITCFLWVGDDEVEPCDFPEAPLVGDIVRDPTSAHPGEYYVVKSRQWVVRLREPVKLNIHMEPA